LRIYCNKVAFRQRFSSVKTMDTTKNINQNGLGTAYCVPHTSNQLMCLQYFWLRASISQRRSRAQLSDYCILYWHESSFLHVVHSTLLHWTRWTWSIFYLNIRFRFRWLYKGKVKRAASMMEHVDEWRFCWVMYESKYSAAPKTPNK
jgi:hypothetical protein